jgi:hypothetical protein
VTKREARETPPRSLDVGVTSRTGVTAGTPA